MSSLPNSQKYDLARQLRPVAQIRRNGKVARLPLELREQINRMLETASEYKVIIKNLGDAGRHLTEHNISNCILVATRIILRPSSSTIALAPKPKPRRISSVRTVISSRQSFSRFAAKWALLQYLGSNMEHGEQLAATPSRKISQIHHPHETSLQPQQYQYRHRKTKWVLKRYETTKQIPGVQAPVSLRGFKPMIHVYVSRLALDNSIVKPRTCRDVKPRPSALRPFRAVSRKGGLNWSNAASRSPHSRRIGIS